MNKGILRTGVPLAGILLLSALQGCNKLPPAPPPKHDKPVRALWHVYLDFQMKSNKDGPKDAGELKVWAKSMDPEYLKKMAVYDIEEAFTSPRDNLPYVVRPVNQARKDGGVVIYEAKGVNGKREVAYGKSGGRAEELTEEELGEALK